MHFLGAYLFVRFNPNRVIYHAIQKQDAIISTRYCAFQQNKYFGGNNLLVECRWLELACKVYWFVKIWTMCICVWVTELPGQIVVWDSVICSWIISRYNRLPSLLGTGYLWLIINLAWVVDTSLLDKVNYFPCRSRCNKVS